jgi:hypothetical protein
MEKGMSTLLKMGVKSIGVACICLLSSMSSAQVWIDSSGKAVDDSEVGRLSKGVNSYFGGIDASIMQPMNVIMQQVSQDLSNLFGSNRAIKANCQVPGVEYYGDVWNKSNFGGEGAGIHATSSYFGGSTPAPANGSLLERGDNSGNTLYTSAPSLRRSTTGASPGCYDPFYCPSVTTTKSIGIFSNSAPSPTHRTGILKGNTRPTNVEVLIDLDTGYTITSSATNDVTGITPSVFQTNEFSGFEGQTPVDGGLVYNKGVFMPIKIGAKFYSYGKSRSGFTSVYGKGRIRNTFNIASVEHLISNGKYTNQIRITANLATMEDGSKFYNGYITHITNPVFRITYGAGGRVSSSQGLIYNGQQTLDYLQRYSYSQSYKNEISAGLKTFNCTLQSL